MSRDGIGKAEKLPDAVAQKVWNYAYSRFPSDYAKLYTAVSSALKTAHEVSYAVYGLSGLAIALRLWASIDKQGATDDRRRKSCYNV